MAERPIFIPSPSSPSLVEEVFLPLHWNSGFAVVQKEKNIRALHSAADAAGIRNVLEVSSKSDNKRGQHLSAFYLKVQNKRLGDIPLESAFQGSKVFEKGGPYNDLYLVEPRFAKRDQRLQESGQLIAFEYDGFRWPLEPKTTFYDWLYISCVYPHREWATKLFAYGGFSDIEFNPFKSINCQARSVALLLSLMKLDALDDAIKSPQTFIQTLSESEYRPQLRTEAFVPRQLFASAR